MAEMGKKTVGTSDDHSGRPAPGQNKRARDDLILWLIWMGPKGHYPEAIKSGVPDFLFDEAIERSAQLAAAINADSFRALQADVLAARADLDREVQRREKIARERDALSWRARFSAGDG